MKHGIWRVFAAGTFAVACVGGFARAQLASDSNEAAVFIDQRMAAPVRDAAVAALRRKAGARGQVRVIVGLTGALQAEDDLTTEQAAAQFARLRTTQNGVAGRAGIAPADVTYFDTIPFVSLWVNAAQLNRLLADPTVVNIQQDVPGTAALNKSGPYIGADTLWDKRATGQGYTVAILDTGVDKNHPMFAGKIVSEACYSTKNNGQGVSPLCPGNSTESTANGSGVNCALNLEPCWHGSHVAGIAGGDSTKLDGIALDAKIIAIKVFSKQGNAVITFDTDWIKGLERVYALRKQFKIAAINMSLGFGNFTKPCDADNPAATKIIRKLRDAGIATVVASMNDSLNNATRAPGCITEAIAVGATLHTEDTLAAYSNHAPWVRLLAPGSDILSAKAGSTGFRRSDGTSMATPHVAGAFALLRDVKDGSTVDDIAAALECTGSPVARAGIVKPRIALVQARSYLLHPPSAMQDYTFTTDAPGWVQNFGGWTVSGDLLHINETTAGYKVATVGNCNEGENIIATGLGRFGPTSGGGNIAGLIFKMQFASFTNLSGYFAGFNTNGTGLLMRFDNYNLQTDNGNFAVLCSGAATLNGSNINDVKVTTRGGTHSLFINGTKICTAKDRAYGTGGAGLLAFMPANSGMNGFGVDRFTIDPVESVPDVRRDAVVASEPAVESRRGKTVSVFSGAAPIGAK